MKLAQNGDRLSRNRHVFHQVAQAEYIAERLLALKRPPRKKKITLARVRWIEEMEG